MANPMSGIILSDAVPEEAIADVNQSMVVKRCLLQKTKHIVGNSGDFISDNFIEYEAPEE